MKLVVAMFALTVGTAVFAQNEEGWNPDTTFPPLSPAEAIKTIEIPKGYRLECIVSEPMDEEPASFAFDGNGALTIKAAGAFVRCEELLVPLKTLQLEVTYVW